MCGIPVSHQCQKIWTFFHINGYFCWSPKTDWSAEVKSKCKSQKMVKKHVKKLDVFLKRILCNNCVSQKHPKRSGAFCAATVPSPKSPPRWRSPAGTWPGQSRDMPWKIFGKNTKIKKWREKNKTRFCFYMFLYVFRILGWSFLEQQKKMLGWNAVFISTPLLLLTTTARRAAHVLFRLGPL